MLDVANLDKWLNSHREECMRCGANQLEFAALESGFMFAVCHACGHKISVRIDTIRNIAFADDAMKALKVLSADKYLPIAFRAECDMVLSLARLFREFFENE
jgi:DNA-directed RNA polymerase subunit RPC12/RpoP